MLTTRIRAIHQQSRQTYGAPRIQAELVASGTRCGRPRVARLMRAAHLSGCHRRRHYGTTRREPTATSAPDRVQRQFVAAATNCLWTADITAIPTHAGFLYLAVVLNVGSRRIVGWSMAAHLRSDLVLAALEMALRTRRPAPGIVHHSDHGSQYTSIAFATRCRHAGVQLSMGTVGDCYDNAITASFVATLKCELLARQTFRTPDAARTAVFDYIEGFYNPHRRHSALGYLSPAAWERRHTPGALARALRGPRVLRLLARKEGECPCL